MPYPGLLYPEPLPLQQYSADLYLRRRYSKTVLSQSLGFFGSWCTHGLFEHSEHLWQIWGLILNWFYPSNCLVGAFPLPLDMGYLLKVAPAPHSCCSNTYYLAGASLPLNRGYLTWDVSLNCTLMWGKGNNQLHKCLFISVSPRVRKLGERALFHCVIQGWRLTPVMPWPFSRASELCWFYIFFHEVFIQNFSSSSLLFSSSHWQKDIIFCYIWL